MIVVGGITKIDVKKLVQTVGMITDVLTVQVGIMDFITAGKDKIRTESILEEATMAAIPMEITVVLVLNQGINNMVFYLAWFIILIV